MEKIWSALNRHIAALNRLDIEHHIKQKVFSFPFVIVILNFEKCIFFKSISWLVIVSLSTEKKLKLR